MAYMVLNIQLWDDINGCACGHIQLKLDGCYRLSTKAAAAAQGINITTYENMDTAICEIIFQNHLWIYESICEFD